MGNDVQGRLLDFLNQQPAGRFDRRGGERSFAHQLAIAIGLPSSAASIVERTLGSMQRNGKIFLRFDPVPGQSQSTMVGAQLLSAREEVKVVVRSGRERQRVEPKVTSKSKVEGSEISEPIWTWRRGDSLAEVATKVLLALKHLAGESEEFQGTQSSISAAMKCGRMTTVSGFSTLYALGIVQRPANMAKPVYKVLRPDVDLVTDEMLANLGSGKELSQSIDDQPVTATSELVERLLAEIAKLNLALNTSRTRESELEDELELVRNQQTPAVLSAQVTTKLRELGLL